MKTIILTFVLIFTSCSIFSQAGKYYGNNPHDSLLFDAAPEYSVSGPCDSGKCLIRISKLEHGIITGWRCRKEKGLLCGVKEVEGIVMRKVTLNVGDYILPGDSIEVSGNRAEFSLSWWDGVLIQEQFTVKFRSAQSWVVPKDFCETNKDWDYENAHMRDVLKLPFRMPGLLWLGIKRLAGAPDFQVETERAVTGPRGTIFSVEFVEGNELVKVYEGSVVIKPKKFAMTANEEMGKLIQDYQSGKITMEEYTKKIGELAPKVKEESINVSKKIIVEAGSQVTVGDGMVGEITPISTDEDKWWEK
ncbi:MAG: hypothetical protein HOP31_00085 [Ignavibacteria bacterium]|nr:hypothetical protein [Ignavibacteria bacterium]